jgi:hypothetical protein
MSPTWQIILAIFGSTLSIMATHLATSFTQHRENKKNIDIWMKKVDDNHKLLQTLLGEHPLHSHTEKRGPLTYDGIKPMKVTV